MQHRKPAEYRQIRIIWLFTTFLIGVKFTMVGLTAAGGGRLFPRSSDHIVNMLNTNCPPKPFASAAAASADWAAPRPATRSSAQNRESCSWKLLSARAIL